MPIVEPEVTLGPGDYTIEETAYWSERVYSHVFRLLNEYDVMLVSALLEICRALPSQLALLTVLPWQITLSDVAVTVQHACT